MRIRIPRSTLFFTFQTAIARCKIARAEPSTIPPSASAFNPARLTAQRAAKGKTPPPQHQKVHRGGVRIVPKLHAEFNPFVTSHRTWRVNRHDTSTPPIATLVCSHERFRSRIRQGSSTLGPRSSVDLSKRRHQTTRRAPIERPRL